MSARLWRGGGMKVDSGGGRRRRQERYDCDLAVICTPIKRNEEGVWEGRVVDVSRGGIRLVVPRRFEAGAILQLRVARLTGGAATPPLLARVAHARPHGEGEWLLGCHLAQELGDDALNALLGGRAARA